MFNLWYTVYKDILAYLGGRLSGELWLTGWDSAGVLASERPSVRLFVRACAHKHF